jgi:hypothetical protein
VNHQLLDREGMKETRRTTKRGQPKNSRRLHRHAPSMELHTSSHEHGENLALRYHPIDPRQSYFFVTDFC